MTGMILLEREVVAVATDAQVDAAIQRVLKTPQTASDDDYRLTQEASEQAGERGNRATAALKGKDPTKRNFFGF